jgi:hypothetical protein
VNTPKAAFVAMLASLLLAFLPGAAAAGSHLQPEAQGLFGTITVVTGNHPRAVAGETDITLETKSGPVELTSTVATRVRIPGFDSASVANLSAGDPVAVLLSGGRAVSILVRTELPVRTRHFTGVVTSVDENGSISLRNREGQQITTQTLGDLKEIRPGELVTAVIEQDPASGGLAITGLDRAAASLERIASALDLAQRSKTSSNIEVLQQRLLGNSAHHLTTMQELSQKTVPALERQVRKELEGAHEAYASALSRFGGGNPRAEVAGIITSIDGPGQQIIIAPNGLDEVEVAITDGTGLWRVPAGLADDIVENWLREESNTRTYVRRFGGREIRFDQLDVASRVRVWYELGTGSATRILLLPGASLPRGPADALISLAFESEAKGAVTSVNLNSVPPTVTIQDEVSGIEIDLSIVPDSTITRDALPIELSSLLGTSVAASYDPKSLFIVELEQLTPADSEAMVHGVVHSFISKVLPGNFLILTVEGEIRGFNHTENTVIRRDGRQVSISEVRLGDLVRPGTSYRTGSGVGASELGAEHDLVVLSLKSPATAPVQGTIRGIADGSGVGTLITLSNNWLELVSLLVTEDTKFGIENDSVGILDLAVGQRVVAGSYDPISSEAVRVVLAAPRSMPINGEITAIDESRSSITLTPRSGGPVNLFVLESTPARIILKGTSDPRLNDLRLGHQVRIGFYDPTSMEALRLVIN